jgi:large subunit ribosomal protein L30
MKKVKITQVKSTIGKSDKQKATVLALGLTRIGSAREHNLTPQIEGMVRKIDFLIRVEEVSS